MVSPRKIWRGSSIYPGRRSRNGKTGAALPDLDTLLKLSRFYGLTINEILEPQIQGAEVQEFEDIVKQTATG